MSMKHRSEVTVWYLKILHGTRNKDNCITYYTEHRQSNYTEHTEHRQSFYTELFESVVIMTASILQQEAEGRVV